MQQHVGHLHIVLSSLQDYILSVKHPKYDFLKSSLHFLSHVISYCGVALDPYKASAICGIAAPTDVSHLCSFFGCTNLYERFVPNYATICALFASLLGSHVGWCWGPP